MAPLSAPRRRSALAALLALLAPAAATAFNPETIFLSPEAALGGGAVLAADDVSGAGWYNPAALGGIRRSSLQLGASAYSVTSYRVRDALVTRLPWQTTSGAASDTSFSSVPAVLAFSYRVTDGVGLAAGLWTPFHGSLNSSLRSLTSGPYPGQPGLVATYDQRYGSNSSSDDTWAGLAVGWQASPGLRVGAALQGAYATSAKLIDLETSLRTSSTDPLQQGAHVNVSVRSDESMVAGRALVGLQWDATEDLRLALVARTPSVRVLAWGGATRLLSVSALLPGFSPQVGQLVVDTSPSSKLSVVDVGRLSAGLDWRAGAWSVRLDGEWSPALDRIASGAKGSWSVRAGALHAVTPDLVLGLGAFREGARARASQGNLEVDQYGLTAGVTVRPAKVLATPGGGREWDLLTTVAVRGGYGTGHGPGMTIVPFELATSQLPIFFGQPDHGFQEVAARRLDGSLHVFTTLAF